MNTIFKGLAKRAAKAVLAVEDLNDEELENFRLGVCRSCDKFDKEDQRCKVCGCFMEVKAALLTFRNPDALRVEFTHCPLGRWNDSHIPKINALIYGDKN